MERVIYNRHLWTSELTIIIPDSTVDQDTLNYYVDKFIGFIESKISNFNSESEVKVCPFFDSFKKMFSTLKLTETELNEVEEFVSYKDDQSLDFTGLTKGYFIARITEFLNITGNHRFLINFGGDGVAYRYHESVHLDVGALGIHIPEEVVRYFATSVQSGKRGAHIKSDNSNPRTVTVISKGGSEAKLAMLADMLSTTICASTDAEPKYKSKFDVFKFNRVYESDNSVKYKEQT